MTPEIIQAIGQYIVLPICGTVSFAALCYYFRG